MVIEASFYLSVLEDEDCHITTHILVNGEGWKVEANSFANDSQLSFT